MEHTTSSSRVATAPTRAHRGRVSPWLVPFCIPALLLLAVPLAALVGRARVLDLAADLASPVVADALTLSIATSSATVLVAILLGTPLAYLLARGRFRGRTLVDSLVDLPMVLPPSVAGVALLVAFGRRGLLGAYLAQLGIQLAFTRAAVVFAQVFVAAPYFVRAAAGAFARVDRDLEDSAALDGASGWGVFRHVTVPLSRPTLVAGAVMTWARALGEFRATIIFAGNFPGRTQTMPLAIYMGFEVDLGVAVTLSIVLLTISFAVLAVVRGLLQRGVFVE